jgi:hypothetical protein
MGKRRGACGVLVANPKRKRPFGRSKCRWECNSKMNFSAVERKSWIELAQGRDR